MLERLSENQQRQLIGAMQTIEKILAPQEKPESGANASYVLRPHQTGEMGWVVHRQGVLYAQEYGYDEEFEAFTAEIVAKFILHYDAKRERCWVAEKDGEVVGSVFLVAKSRTTAKLRLLYVEPSARGLGIGSRLVAECVRFGKKAGFRVVEEKRHHSFGKNLVAETWELSL
jgi:GNAT superfamily N-acetyltransferase